ncbi:MAG: hypothetical protein EOL95_07260 [Bacteroidia bacterium]|nr:hypothetical protein [Bacteroidia bacterium]
MSEEIEDMGIREELEPELELKPEPEPKPKQDNNIQQQEEVEKAEIKMKSAPAKATAKLFATIIDSTIPATLGIIAKEESTDYRAAEEDKQDLEDALTEYVKLKGGDIPPGVMVLILILTIYGSKVPHALQQRKLNQKKEELLAKEKELEAREKAFMTLQEKDKIKESTENGAQS